VKLAKESFVVTKLAQHINLLVRSDEEVFLCLEAA
jgi:hypothetical protein